MEIDARRRANERGVAFVQADGTPKLSVIGIIKEAFLVVARKRLLLLRALMPAGLAMALLSTALDHVTSSWLNVLVVIVNGIIFTLFAVTCHRVVLLDASTVPKYGIKSWSPRETRFLGWTFVGYFYFTALVFIAAILTTLLSGIVFSTATGQEPPHIFLLIAIFPGAFVMARLSILLPATAIDERHNMRWAWDLSSSNGWRLTMIVALLPWLLGTIVGLFEVKHYPIVEFILNIVAFALVAFEIAVLSISFRFLTEASR